MRRVLFPFVGDSVGGAQLSALLLVEGLTGTGYEPVVAVAQEGPLARHLRERGLPFALVPLAVLPGASPRPAAIAAALLRTAPGLAGWLRRHGVALVHGNDLRMNLAWSAAARLAGRRAVWHQRAMPFSASPLWRGASLLAHRVVCTSAAVDAAMPGGRRRRAVIANPFRTEAAPPDRAAARAMAAAALGLAPGTRLAGFAGRLVGWKRPDLFVQAAAAIARAHPGPLAFVVLGEDVGGLGDGLRAMAAAAGIGGRLHLAGFRHPVEPWLAACDVLLAPAVGEPFGRAVVESMLAGTPVVASASGGHVEILDDGRTGLLAPPGDAAALAAAALRVLGSADLAASLAAAARADAQARFGLADHVRRVTALYDAVLED